MGEGRRILISGAGIAGPTLAYWLLHHGFEPVLLERAPALRTGGYVIDFWGVGFDIAESMGLLPELRRAGYPIEEVRMVDRRGRKVSGFSTDVFGQLTGGRYLSIPRGELAAAIHGRLAGKVETLFDDSVRALEPRGDRVRVSFEGGATRDFDLVVGADGLHSRVRELAFGPQRGFERYLGYKVAAFEIGGYPHRDELVYMMHTEVGRQAARFSMRGDRTMFLFVFAADDASERDGDPAHQRAMLVERFADSGWECREILAALDGCESLYFDRVSQIRMPAWSVGRVALVGDAAACPSLLAGQGSALAMIAARVLAGELARSPQDPLAALARYHALLGPFVLGKQRAAESFAGSFAPRTRLGLFVRDQVMKALRFPFVARAAMGRSLRDELTLPAYP